MKIGVVGSGIAGLGVAKILAMRGCDVVVFERSERIGMDAHSLEIPTPSGSVRADVPSRMFNPVQWPGLFQLYSELGIDSVPVDATQSFTDGQRNTYLRLGNAYRPDRWLEAMLRAKSRSILTEGRRLKTDGLRDLRKGNPSSQTLREYLEAYNYGDEFKYEFLYPTLSSTVCTSSYDALDDYPASVILEALDRITGATLLRTKNGTREVVEKLTTGLSEIQTRCAVENITSNSDRVTLSTSHRSLEFEHVIVATQANHLHGLGIDSGDAERFEGIRYQDVEIVVHRDERLMPVDRKHWATFNMISSSERTQAMCTVWLNQFHSDWQTEDPVFQTIMPIERPRDSHVISQVKLQRPTVEQSSFECWESWRRLTEQPGRRIWYCGSYAVPGIPLLESAIQSGYAIAEKICQQHSDAPSIRKRLPA